MNDNEPTGQKHIPGDITTIQLDKETRGYLNKCKGTEEQHRGRSVKQDIFIQFLCRLYEQNINRDECKTALYLSRKER
jgi:hypothetical protein